MSHSEVEKLDIFKIEEDKQSLCNGFNEKQNPIRIVHYRRVSSEISGIFSAPPGVNAFHVDSTGVRKLSTGAKTNLPTQLAAFSIFFQKAFLRRQLSLISFKSLIYTGDSKYVFIWPQQTSRNCSTMPNLLIPIIRTILTGLVSLNTIHLWPGEFMPNRLPSALPPPVPPLKCNVIEPAWDDNY